MVTIEGGAGGTEAENTIFELDVQGASGARDYRYNHENGAGSGNAVTWDTNIANDTFAHACVVRDVAANTVILYLNGASFSTFNYTNDPTNTSSDLTYTVGTRSNGSDDIASMRIAMVYLFDAALTAGEVQHIYHGKFPGRDPLHFAPLFGVASPEPDWGGLAFNGTITGSPTVAANPPIAGPFR
jgi:hypothetical protein